MAQMAGLPIHSPGFGRASPANRRAAGASGPAALFADMLERLSADRLWAREYEDFVDAVSFAAPGERMQSFERMPG